MISSRATDVSRQPALICDLCETPLLIYHSDVDPFEPFTQQDKDEIRSEAKKEGWKHGINYAQAGFPEIDVCPQCFATKCYPEGNPELN